jgi:hypothetical protein
VIADNKQPLRDRIDAQSPGRENIRVVRDRRGGPAEVAGAGRSHTYGYDTSTATCRRCLWHSPSPRSSRTGGDITALGALDDVLAPGAVAALRLRVLHTFVTKSETADAIAAAPLSVVRAAVAIPQYRTAIADRAANVAAAFAQWRRHGSHGANGPDEGCGLQRMLGVLPAVARAVIERTPRDAVSFVRGMVWPELASHIDHAAGSLFETPEQMQELLYDATLRPDLNTVIAVAEQRITELEAAVPDRLGKHEAAVRALEQARKSAPGLTVQAMALLESAVRDCERDLDEAYGGIAACAILGDTCRTILYRVLLGIEDMSQRRRSLASSVGLTSGKDSDKARGVDVALASSSVGAAQSHRSLVELVVRAVEGEELAVTQSGRTTDGHDVFEIAAGDNGKRRVSFYAHRGILHAATHAAHVAPAPTAYRRIDDAQHLLRLVRAELG